MNRQTKHKYLYKPIQIGRVRLKNRIMTPPMLPCLASPEGRITSELIAFAGRLAKAGAGLVSMGETSIDLDRSFDHIGAINLGSDRIIPSLSLLVEEIHRYGAKATIEINHSGACSEELLLEGRKGISPSPLPEYMHPLYRNNEVEIMDRAMMDKVIQNYLDAVGRCVTAGFDMVMIHCAHGWLLGQFLSPSFNKRTDKYGGSIENRMRFPLEVIAAIKEKYGDRIALDMRVSGSPRVPEAVSPDENNLKDLLAFLKAAEQYIDMVNISAGFIPFLPSLEYMIQPYLLPHMTNLEFAEKIKKELHIPVSIAGSIVTLEQADNILREGKADMVGMGRAGLADTDCFVKGEQGRDDEIRPCLRCVSCAARIEPPSFKGIRCAVNPLVGRELQYPRVPAAKRKRKVMIIGGGPAGMEACQRLTEAGHEVVLYESRKELGGMLHTASALPFKQDMRRYLKWMMERTHKSGAAIYLNTKATPELIKKENPDVVLIGIGTVPFKPQVPSAEGKEMIWAGDVDGGLLDTGERVVIVGAGLTGTETAIGLAQEGKKVTVLDRIPQEMFLEGTPGTVRLSIYRLIQELGIHYIFGASLDEVTEEGVVYADVDGKKDTLPCDTAINALGMRVLQEEVEELLSVTPESYVIGDCSGKKMTIGNAVLDAFSISLDL